LWGDVGEYGGECVRAWKHGGEKRREEERMGIGECKAAKPEVNFSE